MSGLAYVKIQYAIFLDFWGFFEVLDQVKRPRLPQYILKYYS